MKPLLVGEVNPYGTDPFFALYPLPENAAGGRLARILGLTRGEYLRRFERINLCDGRWSAKMARAKAMAVRCTDGPPVILLGRRVARAFEWDKLVGDLDGPSGFWTSSGRYYLIPHPSGMNRVWNDPRAVVRTRDFLARFLAPEARPSP